MAEEGTRTLCGDDPRQRPLARSSYLPKPSGALGWTIEAEGVAVAVRGDPAVVTLTGEVHLAALQRPIGSQLWRAGRERM